jgi:hypothetical protein
MGGNNYARPFVIRQEFPDAMLEMPDIAPGNRR